MYCVDVYTMYICYRSESLAQVFIFLLSWLYATIKDLPVTAWSGIWLAYDNMCQLLRYKAGKADLPLPAPYNKMWRSINFIIDAMHVRNHVQEECKVKLHPTMNPELKNHRNTQAAEQTFVWLGRYKKILGSMPKTHHLFYLHRTVKRRNEYIAKCYRNGRKPLYPGKKINRLLSVYYK